MRVGVVGCGYWGSKHVRVLNSLEPVTGVAIIDSNPERLEALSATFSTVQAFSDLSAALPHVDAVVVATPPAGHLDVALQALDAGKHVLVEKPLATSTADARKLVERAESVNRILMVGHTFEYNAAVRELRRRVRGGEFGQIYYLDAAWLNLGLYQPDVNVLWDLAPHHISISNYVLDSVPSSVSAWGSAHGLDGPEDVAYLRLKYADLNVASYVRVSWLDPTKVRRVTVVGSKRMVVYNDLGGAERIRIFDRGVESSGDLELDSAPLSYRYGDIVSPHVPFDEPLTVEDLHFIESAETGTVPQTDGRSGLAVVAALEAADRALAEGGEIPVVLDPLPEEMGSPTDHVAGDPTDIRAAS